MSHHHQNPLSARHMSDVAHPQAHRKLEDYYAYTEDAVKDQHPVMTFLLLFILGIMILSSVAVFVVRCYRKRFKEDCSELTCDINTQPIAEPRTTELTATGEDPQRRYVNMSSILA